MISAILAFFDSPPGRSLQTLGALLLGAFITYAVQSRLARDRRNEEQRRIAAAIGAVVGNALEQDQLSTEILAKSGRELLAHFFPDFMEKAKALGATATDTWATMLALTWELVPASRPSMQSAFVTVGHQLQAAKRLDDALGLGGKDLAALPVELVLPYQNLLIASATFWAQWSSIEWHIDDITRKGPSAGQLVQLIEAADRRRRKMVELKKALEIAGTNSSLSAHDAVKLRREISVMFVGAAEANVRLGKLEAALRAQWEQIRADERAQDKGEGEH